MPYNNSALPGAYNDLQYANYTPVFQQRPVKELTELYKKKADDYTYVAEATNQLQRAVSTTPHLERDKAYLYEVANEVNTALEDFEQSGDLENKVFDTNKLVNNASKKLLALQQRKSNWDASVQDLMAKDKDGNLLKSVDDIKKGIYLLDKRTEDLEYDPVLDTYTGAIGSVNVPNKQNYAEKVAKILDDWKANKITLTDKNGNPLERLNNGYLKAGEVEYTDESELIRSAKSYLMNDPDFMSKVNFDLEYELDVLLSEDEGYRDMTFEDVQGRMSDDLKGVSEYYGFTGDKPIKEQLAEKDVSPEELYRRIRLEQMTNSAIQLGVNKESYKQYSNKYMEDKVFMEALKWQDEHRSGGNKPIDDQAYVSVQKVMTTNIANPTDYTNIKSGYEGSKVTLQDNMRKLNMAVQQGATGEQLETLRNNVKKDRDNIENFERQLNNIRDHVKNESGFNFTPTYDAYVDKVKKARTADRLFNSTRMTEEEIIESNPILPFDQYQNAVIDAFINGNTENMLEAAVTKHDEGRIDYAAEQLRNAYGGEVDTRPYNIDYHRFNIQNANSKDSKTYELFVKSKNEAFKLNPDTFVNGDNNFSTVLDDKDIDIEDVDLKKSEVIPLVESVNKQPGYIVISRDSDGKELSRDVFNHAGELAQDSDIMKDLAVKEAYNRFKDKDLGNLDVMDSSMYSKLSLLYVDNHPIGNSIDDANLYAANPGDRIPITLDRGKGEELQFTVGVQKDYLSGDITGEGGERTYIGDVAFTITSPDNKTFVTKTDEDGNKYTEWDYYREGEEGKTPVIFNSPSEIKEIYGKGMLESEMSTKYASNNPYMEYMNQSNISSDGIYKDIAPIFGSNIKDDVIPQIHKDIYDNVEQLGNDYRGLYVTDSYRNKDSKVGSPTTDHKRGKALDFRINSMSMNLFKSDKEVLKRKYGIIAIEPHNGEKGLASNIREADHFHVVFQ